MTTDTFITILAWPVVLYTGLIILSYLPAYARLQVKPKGWVILAVFLIGLWWIVCK